MYILGRAREEAQAALPNGTVQCRGVLRGARTMTTAISKGYQ